MESRNYNASVSLSNTLKHEHFIISNDNFNDMGVPSVSASSSKNDDISSFEFKVIHEKAMLPTSNDIIAKEGFKAFTPTMSTTAFGK